MDNFADPSQEIKWAVFSVVLSQSSYKIIVVKHSKKRTSSLTFFTSRSSLL